MIKSVFQNEAKVLSGKKIKINDEMRVSLFSGNELIKTNITLKVKNVSEFEQSANVNLVDINEDVKRIIKEFND